MSDPIRYQAVSVLNHIESQHHTLDDLLDAAYQNMPSANRRDRNFLFALTHGTLRWQYRIDWILSQFSKKPVSKLDPVIRNILRMGLFQFLYMDRIPDAAAVNTSVDMARKAMGPKVTGFVNAVLRNTIRGYDSLPFPHDPNDPVEALAVDQSYPPWLIKRWINRLGLEGTKAQCQSMNSIAPLTLRTNTLKLVRDNLIENLTTVEAETLPTPLSPWGISLLRDNRTVTKLPGYREGLFQVQDEAAQLAAMLLNAQPGEHILDACAGLGGKTGHIAQQMENIGKITAIDHRSRKLKQLEKEMQRLGVSIVCNQTIDINDPTKLAEIGPFDRILLDAPCSGLGVLRRHPDGKWRQQERIISKMAQRQRRFLEKLAPLVKPSGVIVYVVCSNEPEENKAVIDHFLNENMKFKIEPVLPYLPKKAHRLVTPEGFFHTLVHRDKMDGFFAARLRKDG